MSGHSKWQQIKRKKAVTDAKRGQEFTRLASQIKIAARAGADPANNPALAEAISRAKAANMPQANIDRLLNRQADGWEEVIYEAFGPSGASLLISARTNNTNRTITEIRVILKRHDGRLGQPGSVAWKFTPRSVAYFPAPGPSLSEDLELALIDAGAEDIVLRDGQLIITAPAAAIPLLEKSAGAACIDVKTAYTASQPLALPAKDTRRLKGLLDELSVHPDIISIHTDANLD